MKPGRAAVAALLALLLTGCSTPAEPTASPGRAPSATATQGASPPTPGLTSEPAPEPEAPYVVSDGRPRDAWMSVPRLGIDGLEVRTYQGWTDDAPGHAIQNTGMVRRVRQPGEPHRQDRRAGADPAGLSA